MSEQMRHEYVLLTGEIVFREKDAEVINSIRTNGVLITDAEYLNTAVLGKAQQILQMNFHKKMQDPSLEILDVIILNIVALGKMTADEFSAPPAGTKLQEKTETSESNKVDGSANDPEVVIPPRGDALDNVVSIHSKKED